MIATAVKTDLRFPEPLYLGLTIYLLAAIGFKGGVAMSVAGVSAVWLPALGAMALGASIPLWSYTLFAVEGTGAKGARVADIEEFTNIQIEVIVPEPVAQRLMERIQRELLPHFAMIVFETDVRVLRQEKF